MVHANFIENPLNRGPYDKSVLSPTLGYHYDSVYIEVSLDTFITGQFREWLQSCIFTRMPPSNQGIRITILPTGN